MEKRLKNIMANVFGVQVEEINEMTSVDNCEEWIPFNT